MSGAAPNIAVLARLRKFSHGAMAMIFFTAMSGQSISRHHFRGHRLEKKQAS